MQKLKTYPPPAIVRIITLVAFVTFFILAFILLPLDGRLQAAGSGIVDYELAFTSDRATEMLNAWGAAGQDTMRDSLFLDFPFLLSYGLAFSGLTLLIGRAQSGRLASLGLWLAPAGMIAAACDAVENVLLFTTLGHAVVPALPILVAGICASVKFALWLVVFVYWLVSGVTWGLRKLRAP
ncbi:MAG: hypothetical protein JXA21_19255 [Anaerolineae bacterium]|nr:hypothetical protein [Anaerolineae bacterium]